MLRIKHPSLILIPGAAFLLLSVCLALAFSASLLEVHPPHSPFSVKPLEMSPFPCSQHVLSSLRHPFLSSLLPSLKGFHFIYCLCFPIRGFTRAVLLFWFCPFQASQILRGASDPCRPLVTIWMDRWMDKVSLPGLTVSFHEKYKFISLLGNNLMGSGWGLTAMIPVLHRSKE